MIALLLGCASNDPYIEVLQSLGEEVFLPNYAEVVSKSDALKVSVYQYCESPETHSIEDVHLAWKMAREPWKRMEFLNIGPYKEPDRLGYKIDFWPVRINIIEEVLFGESIISNEAILSYPAATKGFPAMEWLVFSDHDYSNPRYCMYLQSIAYDLHYHSEQLYQAWDPEQGNYLSHLTEADLEKDYNSTKEAMTEIVNKLGHTIANIRALKLMKPLGEAQGVVQVELLESRYSQNSLIDIRSNLEGISAVYYGPDGGLGVKDLLPSGTTEITSDFDRYLSESYKALDALHNQGSLEEAMFIDPDSVEYLSTRLRFLQEHIQEDILLALSFWTTFNDADGD